MDNAEKKKELRNELRDKWIKNKPFAFVSYASNDWEKVYPIVIALRKKGFNIYIDTELEENASEDWLSNIERVFFDAELEVMLVFLSPSYLRSYACMCELLMSRSDRLKEDRGSSLLPILYVSLEDAMASLQKINAYMFSSDSRRESRHAVVEMTPKENKFLKDTIHNCSFLGEDRKKPEKIDNIADKHNIVVQMMEILEKMDQYKSYGISTIIRYEDAVDTLERNFTGDKNQQINLQPLPELMEEKSAVQMGAQPAPAPQPAPVPQPTAQSRPGAVGIPVSAVRQRFSDSTSAAAFRKVREGMPFGGKGAMDYAMTAVLGGCNDINDKSPVYKKNYYLYDVASLNEDKKKNDGKLGATWSWSSNCRKVLGLPKSGKIPTEINEVFEDMADTTMVEELIECFASRKTEAFCTQKNDLVILALQKLIEFMNTQPSAVEV